MQIFGLAALALCVVLPLQAQGFCDKVRALTVDSAVAAAHWGVAVTTLDGTLLCGVNEAQLFRPASNAKLFTTSAALALLGAKTTFITKVTGKLDAATGAVQGDLALVGGGMRISIAATCLTSRRRFGRRPRWRHLHFMISKTWRRSLQPME